MLHCFKIFSMYEIVENAVKSLADSKPEWLVQFTVVYTKSRGEPMYFLLTNDDVKDKKQMATKLAELNLNASYMLEYLF